MTGPRLKVLTYNLYLGGDVAPLINAPHRDVPGRVERLWRTVQDTNWASRARAIAAAIAESKPDVIALQEAYRWSTVTKLSDVEVVHDFLATLLDALAAADEPYVSPVRAWGVTVELPSAPGPDIRFEDSVAILVRSEGGPISSWSRPRQGRFATSLHARLDGEPFAINRPWASVDVDAGRETVRVITAHFEYFGEGVQSGQVNELLDGPVAVDLPIILLGDFNQTPGSPVWHLLNRRGFVDAWLVAGDGPGATSSQATGLRNEVSTLGHRIDWVLVRGPIDVEEVSLVGDRPGDRTPEGLWPSDHAGVQASLRLRPAPESAESRQAVTVMRDLFDGFVRQDIEAVMALIDPDSHWSFPGDPAILPWAGTYRGAELPRFFQACISTLDYLEYVAHTFHVDGDVVTIRSNERCRVKRTGKIFRHDLTAVARVTNGKIVQFIEYGDTAAMQAGFID